jgi:hypothetical protein
MMRVLRALAASVLWILAGVLALLGVVLSITIILLPLGIPLLLLARKLVRYSMTLLLPRAVRHPGEALGTSAEQQPRRKHRSVMGRLKRAF